MKFVFAARDGKTILRPIFEDGDEYTGRREEGPGKLVTYSGDDITFDYVPKSVHPDILGLLCLVIFYPFIGQRVLFPTPVSPRLEYAFRNQHFARQFRFDNVDHSIKRYRGTRMGLSFGGGIDSTAVRILFPEAFIIHEAHIKQNRLVPSYSSSVVHELGPQQGRVVVTNQRYVSPPGGWHGWPCALATTLLMATDLDLGIALTGTIIGSTLLLDGTRYWNRFKDIETHGPTGNYWQSAFNEVGLPMFSPVAGTSEYMTMKLSMPAILDGEVVWCQKVKGGACHRCPKCFRRDLIRAVIDQAHNPEWSVYCHSQMYKHLELRPLPMSHIISYARDRIEPPLPTPLRSRLESLPSIESDWPLKVDTRTFRFCDGTWREPIRQRVLSHISPMDSYHVSEMQTWDVSPPDKETHPGYGGVGYITKPIGGPPA